MKRRNFISTSTTVLGGMSIFPSFTIQFLNEEGLEIKPAMDDKIRIRIINTGNNP